MIRLMWDSVPGGQVLSMQEWLRCRNAVQREIRGKDQSVASNMAASYRPMSYTARSYASLYRTDLHTAGSPAYRQLALIARSGLTADVEAARGPDLLLFMLDDLLP
jgi:hypothetical protein